MKRYQIAVQWRQSADIFIEAETEAIAREYVKSLPIEHFTWRSAKQVELLLVDQIEIEPAVTRTVTAAMTNGQVLWHNLLNPEE